MKAHKHQCPICNTSHECECHEHGGLLYQLFKACDLCFYKRAVAVLGDPRKAVANMVILALLLFPFAQLRAQDRHRIRVPETASRAVFEQTGASFARLRTKQQLGQDTALDYAIAGANLRTMIAHMDETGLTDSMEKYILENPSRFTEFPNEPELQEAFSRTTVEQREAFVEHIRARGLKAFHQEILSVLDLKTAAMLRQGETHFVTVQNGGNGFGPRAAAPPANSGSGPAGNPTCSNWANYISWAGDYFSIVAFVTGIGAPAFWIGLAISYIGNVYAC